jgi:hypothetical protein
MLMTLNDISGHFLHEVIRADTDFQKRQEEAWSSFESDPIQAFGHDLSRGFKKMEYLYLSEIKYDFLLVPAQEPFLIRLGRIFNPGRKRYLYFKLKKREKESDSTQVSFCIQRKPLGKYISEITSTPKLNLSNDLVNVLDFTR